jgi:hypothetical protein
MLKYHRVLNNIFYTSLLGQENILFCNENFNVWVRGCHAENSVMLILKYYVLMLRNMLIRNIWNLSPHCPITLICRPYHLHI